MNQKTQERAEKLLEYITEEMDITFGATTYPWRMRVSPSSYKALKDYDAEGRPSWRRELFYEKDGHEYIRAIHNENAPFILHYRVVIDDSLKGKPFEYTAVELDDEIEPRVRERYDTEWRGTPSAPPVPKVEPELTVPELIAMIRELAMLDLPCGLERKRWRHLDKSFYSVTLTYPGNASSSRSFPPGYDQELDITFGEQVTGWALTTMEAKGYFLNLEHTPTQVTATVFKLAPGSQERWLRLGAYTGSYSSLFTAHQGRLKVVLEAFTQTMLAVATPTADR